MQQIRISETTLPPLALNTYLNVCSTMIDEQHCFRNMHRCIINYFFMMI